MAGAATDRMVAECGHRELDGDPVQEDALLEWVDAAVEMASRATTLPSASVMTCDAGLEPTTPVVPWQLATPSGGSAVRWERDLP
jgi:hypothetical protein